MSRVRKPTRIPKIKLGSVKLDVMKIFRMGAAMDAVRKAAAADATPPLDGVIEMVEVAPQTFAPKPRRASTNYPLAAAFEELKREAQKR